VFGFKAGTGRTRRAPERYAADIELELTDRAGRVWRPRAQGLTTFPWQCWANMVAFNVLASWECDGQQGYGEIMDFFELPQLTALNAAASTRVPSAPG
jgi:hypothetical protein